MKKLTLLLSVAGLACLGGATLLLLGGSERSSCFNPGGTGHHTTTCSKYGPTLAAGRLSVGLGIALLLVGLSVIWTRRSRAARVSQDTDVQTRSE